MAKNQISNLIANSYSRLLLTRHNKNDVHSAFKTILSRYSKRNNNFELWSAIDDQIVKADHSSIKDELIKLRNKFQKQFVSSESDRLEEAFNCSAPEGWREFLKLIIEAVSYFRIQFCLSICENKFRFPVNKEKQIIRIKKALRYMVHTRWLEAYDQIKYLSELDYIAKEYKARLLIILGEIQLYHIFDSNKAKELFDAAEKLLSGDTRVYSGLGEYYLDKKDFEKALKYFERSIEIDPDNVLGYLNMGELCHIRSQYQDAEKWYRTALETDSGYSTAYKDLIRLFARDEESLKKNEGEILNLFKKAIIGNPEDEYNMIITIGSLYKDKNLYEYAISWCNKAVKHDKYRLDGYREMIECYMKAGKTDFALKTYRKAIKVASLESDSYYLGVLNENLEQWDDAIKWYLKSSKILKGGKIGIICKLGEMYWKLGDYKKAESKLKESLNIDKEYDYASVILENVALDSYKKKDDAVTAERIYNEIIKFKGESYRAFYHNRMGNLRYWYDKYEDAIVEYHKAIDSEKKPGDPVFHRNLGLAYKNIGKLEEAKEQINKVYDLDKDRVSYNMEMALILNEEGNDFYSNNDFSSAISKYKESVEFDSSYDVIFSNLGGAWENYKEPGRRIEAIDNAIQAYESAKTIADKEDKNDTFKEYEKKLSELRRKRKFIESFGEKSSDWLNMVTPIALEFASNLIPYSEGGMPGSLSDELTELVSQLRDSFSDKFGVKIPGIRFRGNETDLPFGTYIILISEIAIVSGNISTEMRFFPGQNLILTRLGIIGEEAVNPLDSMPGYWIKRKDWNKTSEAGLKLWEIIEYPIRHLQAVLTKSMAEFVGHQDVIDTIQRENPEAFIRLKKYSDELTALTNVCKSLISEEVSMKPMNLIISKFNESYKIEKSLTKISESIRSLAEFKTILSGIIRNHAIFKLGNQFEDEIKNSIYSVDSNAVLAMEPEKCQESLSILRNALGGSVNNAIIVESTGIRHLVRKLVEIEFPDIHILSSKELVLNKEYSKARIIELEKNSTSKGNNFDVDESKIYSSYPRGKGQNKNNTNYESGDPENLSDQAIIMLFVNKNYKENPAEIDKEPIEKLVDLMREGLFFELGIILPIIKVEVDPDLKPGAFRFGIKEMLFGPFEGLDKDEVLVNETSEGLNILRIKGNKTLNPANGTECAIIQNKNGEAILCEQAGFTTWGPAGYLIISLSSEIRKNASLFLTPYLVQQMLDSLASTHPDLIRSLLNRFDIKILLLVLRNLLEEEISIRDLTKILESLLSINGTTDIDFSRYIVFTPNADGLCPVEKYKDTEQLTTDEYENYVRISLKRYISHKYTRGGNTLSVYLLAPELEKTIALLSKESGTFNLDIQKILGAISSEIAVRASSEQINVILTSIEIRKKLWRLIHSSLPQIAVLCYQELVPDMNIQPIARINFED